MMSSNHLLSEALSLYAFKKPQTELIRHNENMTYKVTDASKCYVLRVHEHVAGFSSDIHDSSISKIDLIHGELDVIAALKNGTDIPMQSPVHGKNGSLVQVLAGGTPVTLLEWAEGQTVESAEMTPELLRNTEKLMATMHEFLSRQKETGKQYARYGYDQTTLTHITKKIECAARVEAISTKQARVILKALDETRRRLNELDATRDKHIVHADLGKSNVIINPDGRLTPIDFSLCGYSHFYMDIGGIYGLNHDDKSRKHIIEGYRSVCDCEMIPRYIEPYFALGIVLFISSQYERVMDWDWFPGHMKRWCRDVFQPLGDDIEFIK
jgi:Ser/Thr protein kinase RdoA (MazF antagonist)